VLRKFRFPISRQPSLGNIFFANAIVVVQQWNS